LLVIVDYIIVGAGTAGCVLADKLSANGRNQVLLVEAGRKPRNPFIKIPAGFAKLFKSGCDWNYESAPGCGPLKRQIYIPRGKMLGGSANMNAMIHQWGHPDDFAAWVESGATGWGWDSVHPIFTKMDERMECAPNSHAHAAVRDFVHAARSVIGNSGDSYNGGGYEGAWIAHCNVRNGKRFSVYDSHLKPAMRRRNLITLTGMTVSNLITENGSAVGVMMDGPQGRNAARAKAGVVLTAGAIETPALLLRSGIGSGASLQALGIETYRDSRHVGQHLQDHPMMVTVFQTTHCDTYKSAESPANLMRYIFKKTGPLASNAAEAIAFSSDKLSAPDIELIFAPFQWREQALQPPAIHGFSIGAAIVAPHSRGSVSLTTRHIQIPPRIDFGFFTDKDGLDRKAMIAAVLLARKIAAQPSFSDHVSVEQSPGINVKDYDTLFTEICRNLQTVYNPAGTCRIGSSGDGVVSPRLKVHGLDRLWIADASVMPQLVRGHPNAAVAMIASRAAEFIAKGA
jgi:choline dehydrogenase